MKYVILVGLMLCLSWEGKSQDVPTNETAREQDIHKVAAFTVLRQKCNTCHATKRRASIFTYENMDSLSKLIYSQVFIKQKMPKGRNNALTEVEEKQLKKWLSSLERP